MKNTGLYPKSRVDVTPVSAVGQAGGVLLTETVRVTGLDRALSDTLAGWPKPFAGHDPGKALTDLAIALALGGDAVADVGVLRGEPSVYGHVASDPTVSRLIAALAGDADRAVAAISSARAAGRARAWTLAGEHAPSRGCDSEGSVGHRSGCDADHRAFGEGAGRREFKRGSARPGKKVLIRADGAGGTRQFITWLTGRRLAYSPTRSGSRCRSRRRHSTG